MKKYLLCMFLVFVFSEVSGQMDPSSLLSSIPILGDLVGGGSQGKDGKEGGFKGFGILKGLFGSSEKKKKTESTEKKDLELNSAIRKKYGDGGQHGKEDGGQYYNENESDGARHPSGNSVDSSKKIPQGQYPGSGSVIYENHPGTAVMNHQPGTTNVAQYPGSTHVAQHPGSTHIVQHPGSTFVAQHPGSTYVAQHPGTTNVAHYPGSTHVAQHPGSTHVAQHPGSTYVAQHPGSTYVAQHPGSTYVAQHPGATQGAHGGNQGFGTGHQPPVGRYPPSSYSGYPPSSYSGYPQYGQQYSHSLDTVKSKNESSSEVSKESIRRGYQG